MELNYVYILIIFIIYIPIIIYCISYILSILPRYSVWGNQIEPINKYKSFLWFLK